MIIQRPFRGTLATIGGMAWARAAIFYGSDFGKEYMQRRGWGGGAGGVLASALPPLVCSSLVQVANMPLIRSTITIQNPASELHTVRAAMLVGVRVGLEVANPLASCVHMRPLQVSSYVLYLLLPYHSTSTAAKALEACGTDSRRVRSYGLAACAVSSSIDYVSLLLLFSLNTVCFCQCM